MQVLALVAAGVGSAGTAMRLLGFVDAVYERRGAIRELTEETVLQRTLQACAERLTPGECEALRLDGRALDIEGARALASMVTAAPAR